jgi:hypothetical protein
LLLVFLLVAMSFPLAPKATLQSIQQTAGSRSETSADDHEAFVPYQNERGEFACRSATKAESDQMVDHSGGGSSVVYEGAPMGKDIDSGGKRWNPKLKSNLNLLPSAGLPVSGRNSSFHLALRQQSHYPISDP